MVNTAMANTSDLLVGYAMAVYAGSLLAYSWDLSGRGKAMAGAAEPAPELVGVRAGTGGATVTEGSSEPESVAVASSSLPFAGDDRPSKAAGIGTSLAWVALLLHLGALLTRGLAVSRVPWGNMYEFALTGSALMSLVYLVMVARRRAWRIIGTFVVGPVLLVLGMAVLFWYTVAARLVPALQDSFLVIHVSVASLSVALFAIAFSVQVLQLVRGRPAGGRLLDRLPSTQKLEQAGYRLIAMSFPLWTFTVVAGAIWAEKSWGRYWGWDPKEVWSFVIWVVYAAYLHARVTRGWDGRRATYLALAGFVCVVLNFVVVNVFFVGQHSYSGIG
ncbi:MAG: c-type cytochrome biogenesis protein CcsB [Micrococcales bacterium]|nr:MAG: c-type cytochrome biogenesis protein CcsB [Micrococcales bacterium]PIE25914.1 MAG: c-type cytochrome biogenesis protein CcsB [Micrococcales bacterium]